MKIFCCKTLATTPLEISWKTLVTTPPRNFLENSRYYPPSKFLGKLSLLPPLEISRKTVDILGPLREPSIPPPHSKGTRLNTVGAVGGSRQGCQISEVLGREITSKSSPKVAS